MESVAVSSRGAILGHFCGNRLRDVSCSIFIGLVGIVYLFVSTGGVLADTDTDGDGLSNATETALGTDPIVVDEF